ncbi:envelope protein UL20 [Testudinid alphaherpesvirus 3]|uniref:Envelope protein UL20 n=1 Tax=Testudinid alphaherpesvirus 3 TaxID=2560801 RepID=A0A0K1R180_9ALPH|nr:envelope protein UL20 [Testudinid alphaherpesvirus 3]AIU39275.1 envelope protein UL20 [Testudinid alphaherpesvirus 3]AIU39385.1 envelope protein UL20 [Testudinid alphaherpesvirus 3]AKI81661.1 envelope protein UL20 [Testudinid alphaherpesvirus 3]AKI81764.1 envelope protein UL20 [Testudinid alphaherpesvirus 3]AKV40692.1 multifunctional protein [Testudinid alphaherpesvirus 3]
MQPSTDISYAPLLAEEDETCRLSNDYLVTSHQAVSSEDLPVCRKSTIFSLIAVAALKFINCIIFFMYYQCTSVNVYFIVSIFITLIYYAKELYMLLCLYINIRADRMPHTWTQRIISLLVDIICPGYFVYVFYSNVFINGDFFVHLFDENGGRCLMVSYIFFVSMMMYVAGIIYDTIDFVAPRLWTYAILNIPICY